MRIVKAFLKDQILDFVGYGIVTILILFYFYLKIGNGFEIIYPVLLMLFVTGVITIVKGIHYFRFHNALKSANYGNYQMSGVKNQEQLVIDTIQELHRYYHNELSQLMQQRDESNAFIAQMAHDLKIPISVIRLVLEDIEGEHLSEENSARIKGESDKVLNKLSGILSYLRLGQFEKDFLIERVNLIEEIRNAINIKKDYFILNKIYPQFDSQQDAIFVLTDRKWHGMLLDQIISNAIKYSAVKGETGYIHFDINQEENSVELKVTDFGIGIPSYDLERIFEPFFTGENGRLVENSSGIGLYLCRNISKKLGHQLSVSAVKGEKTEVRIRYLSKL